MPSTKVFGLKARHLANDFTFVYFTVAIVQVLWAVIFIADILHVVQPIKSDACGSVKHVALYYTMLALFGFQALICCTATALSLRGTPLEPSKRRWIGPITDVYLISLPVSIGILIYALVVVLDTDGTCWSTTKRQATNYIIAGFTWEGMQPPSIWLMYLQLCDADSNSWWHSMTRKGTGYVIHIWSNWRGEHRGPLAPYEELAAELQRLLVAVDAEKTDVVAGLACAALLQGEAAAGVAAVSQAALPEKEDEDVGLKKEAAGSTGAGSEVLAWAEQVSRDAVPGPAVGAQEEGSEEEATKATTQALQWAPFAVAGFGARLHVWRRGKGKSSWNASRQLSRAVKALQAAKEEPLDGWGPPPPGGCCGSKQWPSKATLQDFAAVKELLGPSHDIISFCSGVQQGVHSGLLPHVVALDREKHAVVLGIAGTWMPPHLLADTAPLPSDWLAGGSAPAVEVGEGNSWVHAASLEAAQCLVERLGSSRVLQRLLRAPGEDPAAAGKGAEALPDCRGWQLVLTGHGLGAGAAALLALKLQSWQPSLAVWAFAPPGQLCSPDLAAALAGCCRTTCVVVGDDFAPRANWAARRTLVEQMLVGLARLRYSKTGLQLAQSAEGIAPKKWGGKWLNPGRALRPVRDIPKEALAYLERYRAWVQEKGSLLHNVLPCSLPGRVLLLSRLPAPQTGASKEALLNHAAAAEGSPKGSVGSGSKGAAGGRQGKGSESESPAWLVHLVTGEQMGHANIRVSRHAVADHWASRLLGVLADLAAAGDGKAQASKEATV